MNNLYNQRVVELSNRFSLYILSCIKVRIPNFEIEHSQFYNATLKTCDLNSYTKRTTLLVQNIVSFVTSEAYYLCISDAYTNPVLELKEVVQTDSKE